ncbi:hypothetical protein [Glutamicibacter sp. TV12E]|uniref:hypothetical protein n=1 Tax=Glutamicibacter sp. TV12E TaxID=3446362 RepID=UPI004033CE73
MHVEIPATCGNAPRHRIITDVLAAAYGKDLPLLEQWFSEDIQWNIAGIGSLDGFDAVRQWILEAPATGSVQFLSVLTHGSEGSTDGRTCDSEHSMVHFSHVLKFASAGKAAKIKEIRSYFVQQPAIGLEI